LTGKKKLVKTNSKIMHNKKKSNKKKVTSQVTCEVTCEVMPVYLTLINLPVFTAPESESVSVTK